MPSGEDFIRSHYRTPAPNQDDYDRLEQLLIGYAAEVEVIDDDGDPRLITSQLTTIGIAFVRTVLERSVEIKKTTGIAIAHTFEEITEPTKEALREGNFGAFAKEYTKRGYADLRIAFKSMGFINRPPISHSKRADTSMKMPSGTECVFTQNSLTATNNIDMWDLVPESLHPDKWFVHPLITAGHHGTVITEDGVKIMQNKTYAPTQLHYDGQHHAVEVAARRVQIIYTEDTGPVRLFVVPGTQNRDVQAIIEQITGGVGIVSGFVTLKSSFDRHPRLGSLLYKYGVTLEHSGMIMFKAGVWHMEAVHGEVSCTAGLLSVKTADPALVRAETRKASLFRVFCGVVSLPEPFVNDAIIMAYMREHGWAMEPFASGRHQNGSHPLFANDKSTQYKTIEFIPDTDEFNLIRKTSIRDMKVWLQRLTPTRLKLYGLTVDDLEK